MARESYFSPFRLWEGSLLCRKSVVDGNLEYPALARDEDHLFTELLIDRGLVYPLVAPGLYIYTAHASNTWPRTHFQKIFSLSQKLSRETTTMIGGILAGNHSIAKSSNYLRSREVLGQLNYFPGYRPSWP